MTRSDLDELELTDQIASFRQSIEGFDLASAHRLLAHWISVAAGLDFFSILNPFIAEQKYEGRLLPLLKRWTREQLRLIGLERALEQLEQNSIPAAVSTFVRFASGWYVIQGCRPSPTNVEVVILTRSERWFCRELRDSSFKNNTSRHAESLPGFNYNFIGIINIPDDEVIRAVWINGARVDFNIHNISDSTYIDQIDELLHLYRQAQVPLDCLARLMKSGGFQLAEVLSRPLKNADQWCNFIHQDIVCGRTPSGTEGTTLIIPLFRLWHEFMQGHVASFSLNPVFNDGLVQVMYVVDDPTIEKIVFQWARIHLEDCPYSIRIISLRQNVGFGMACNIAISASQTERIVLMNSDVMPIESGWFNELNQCCEINPKALVSPILLYENNTVQHAGMQLGFSYSQSMPIPCNLHHMKGLALNQLLKHFNGLDQWEVPALSGAVLAFSRNLFLGSGGFDPIFGSGDFEDLDLSLRWKKNIGELLVCSKARLIHLERQSMETAFVPVKREWQERFNACCALHTNLQIQQLSEVT